MTQICKNSTHGILLYKIHKFYYVSIVTSGSAVRIVMPECFL